MRVYFFLFFLLVLIACKDDTTVKPDCVVHETPTSTDSMTYIGVPRDQEYGWAKAIYINKEWEASCFATYANSDSSLLIFMETYAPGSFVHLLEVLSFNFQEPLPGCYEIQESLQAEELIAIAEYATYDHDVIRHLYHLNSAAYNYLEITEVHEETQTLEGKFMLSFIRDDTTANDPWDPHHVRIMNGEFECRVKE